MPAFLDNPDSDLKTRERARISTGQAERIFQASGGLRLPVLLRRATGGSVSGVFGSQSNRANYVKGVFDVTISRHSDCEF